MDRLRVLTLNIWNRQGPWEERVALIREGIRRLDPDVVGLQEVLCLSGRSLADDIREGLGYEAAFGLAHDLGGGMMFGNAVLSRFPIAKQEVHPLPTGGTGESRSLFETEISAPTGPIPFFVTHLNWKLHHGVVREAQVTEVAERVLAGVSADGAPPILVGDFNAQPEATEIRFLLGLHSLGGKSVHFMDAFGQAGEGAGATFDPKRNPYAALTHEPPRRIDYVFVLGGDLQGRGKPLAARVVLDEVASGVAPSDHYGVYAELAL